ncbi:flagellar basal body rod protein FlgB [bacterium]|nr:flagellar basal body rod protein FlgB [bacterium]
MLKGIFQKTPVPFIEKMLDVAGLKQRVISGNVANVMTPGYQRRDVDFAASLKEMDQASRLTALREDLRHMPFSGQKGADGLVNTLNEAVDLETEMAASAENQILYHTAANLIGRQFRGLHTAIRGRN